MKIRATFLMGAALAVVAFGAQASIINYTFTATGGHSGSFSYDDAAVSIGNGPFATGGVAYDGISFVIDGTSYVTPELVIYPDFGGNQFAYFTTAAGNPYVQLADTGTGLFSSGAASQMDGRNLASFDGLPPNENNQLYLGGNLIQLTSLQAGPLVAVPEPAVVALMLAGLAGLAGARRRKG